MVPIMMRYWHKFTWSVMDYGHNWWRSKESMKDHLRKGWDSYRMCGRSSLRSQRLPGVQSPSVLEQCSDPKLSFPGGLTCTQPPLMDFYFWHNCNSPHCWGSSGLRAGGGDVLVGVDCRCECKTFIQPRPPGLSLNSAPIFSTAPPLSRSRRHCSLSTPGQLVNQSSSGPIQRSEKPAQWPTVAHCLPPLYRQDLHYLLQPSPLLAHYGYGSEDIYIILWLTQKLWAEFRKEKSISQLPWETKGPTDWT